MTARQLDVNAVVPTYAIDRIMQGSTELAQLHNGHAHYLRSKARSFRHAFNSAALAATRPIDPPDHHRSALVFREVERLLCLLHKTDPERLFLLLPVGERRCGIDPEQDVLDVEESIASLRAALDRFFNDVQLVTPTTPTGGNHDHLTSTFITQLAGDGRLWPFVPLTASNYKKFAQLLAAGWQDLGLPRGQGGKSYASVYGWLADRVRTQFGFRPKRNSIQNPNDVARQ